MFYRGLGFIQIREFYFCKPFLFAFAIIFNLALVKVGIDSIIFNLALVKVGIDYSVLQFLIAFLAVVWSSS